MRRLFASYSRRDARRVHELVRLLRLTGAPVFLDTDSIAPGTRWRDEIARAVGAADAVVVFWSAHAAQSREVAGEVRIAHEADKPLVPVSLDETPLPPELAVYQGVDLAGLYTPHDPAFDPAPWIELLAARLLAAP